MRGLRPLEGEPSAVGGWRQALRGWKFEVGGKKIGEKIEGGKQWNSEVGVRSAEWKR